MKYGFIKVAAASPALRLGDWRMPSDASARLWLEELDRLEKE